MSHIYGHIWIINCGWCNNIWMIQDDTLYLLYKSLIYDYMIPKIDFIYTCGSSYPLVMTNGLLLRMVHLVPWFTVHVKMVIVQCTNCDFTRGYLNDQARICCSDSGDIPSENLMKFYHMCLFVRNVMIFEAKNHNMEHDDKLYWSLGHPTL